MNVSFHLIKELYMLNIIKEVNNVLQTSYDVTYSKDAQGDFQKAMYIMSTEALVFGNSVDKAIASGTLCAVKKNNYAGMLVGSGALALGRIKRRGFIKNLGVELAVMGAVFVPKFL